MRQAERIIVNALSNYAVTVVSMAASVVLLSVVVEALTRPGFGMAALVLAPFGVFQLLSNAIGRGLHRYIPQDLAASDAARLNATFNTALCGYLLLGLFGAIGLWFTRRWLLGGADVSAAHMADARVALGSLCVWLVIGLPGMAYQRGLESIQRYDLLGAYNGGAALLRTLVLLPLFWMGHGSITLFVCSQFVLNMAVSFLARRSLLHGIPGLRESARLVNARAGRLLASFGLGTILVIAGNIMASEGFKIFVGKYIGFDELGGLAAVLTLTTMMWRLINDMTNVFAPAVSALEARGSHGSISKLMSSGTKYSVLVAGSMCLVPVAVSGSLFRLWLGEEFAGLEAILYVILLAQIPLCSGGTAVYVMMGLGKLKVAGPIVFLRSGGGLLLSLAYVTLVDRSLTAAVACMFGAQAIGGMVVFLHCCRLTGIRRWNTLAEAVVRPILIAMAGAVVTWAVGTWMETNTWSGLIVSILTGEAVFLGLIAALGLNVEERSRIVAFVSSAKHRLTGAARRPDVRRDRP